MTAPQPLSFDQQQADPGFRNDFLSAIDPASRAYDEMVACAARFDGSYEAARDRVHAIILGRAS